MSVTPFRRDRKNAPAAVYDKSARARPGRRLRIAGLSTLIAGLAGAALLYWLETRNAGPTMEELMPGYSQAAMRQSGMMYGHLGELTWEARQALARPDTQAVLVLLLAGVIAIGCFRVAWVDDKNEQDE